MPGPGPYIAGDALPSGQPDTTTPPIISNIVPSGSLPKGTTQTTMSCDTDENATVKYDTIDTSYDSMANTFSTTGGTSHSQLLTGLANGESYTYYLRAKDVAENKNTTSTIVHFTISKDPTYPDRFFHQGFINNIYL